MILGSAIRSVHIGVGWSVIGANAIAGVWALGAHRNRAFGGRPLWAWIIFAQVLIFVQATLGVTLQNVDNLEPDDFHYLYGFSMIIAVAILYGYRQQMMEHRYLLYGGGSLFVAGLGIRALYLGGPG